MSHPMMNDDVLSLSMFWAGLMMVFMPLIFAGTVIGVWWRQRVKAQREADSQTVKD
jgi:hypothetical protein